MTTLSHRATPAQHYILRAVAGAVRNVAHVHPGWITDPRAAGSIAKRATGTLTSQWGAVLAADRPSKKATRTTAFSCRQRPVQYSLPDADALWKQASRASAFVQEGRSPNALRQAVRAIGVLAGEARRRGDKNYLSGLEDALRILAKA